MKRLTVMVTTLALTLTGGVASACLHRMKVEKDPEVKMLVAAEKDLKKQRYGAALKGALTPFPSLATETVPTTGTGARVGKLRRAMAIAAVVAVRTGGAMGPNGKKTVKRKIQAKNLNWAVDALGKLAKARSYDNKLQARHAEGLARVGQLPQAKLILDKLALKDLMPDAQSYATLAALKGANGDKLGKKAALKRCKMRSSKKGACALPKLAAGTASKSDNGPSVM